MLFQWYARDFGQTHDDMLTWLKPYVTHQCRKDIGTMVASGDYVIDWYYDWTPEPKPFISG
jgi:hypothetical protein